MERLASATRALFARSLSGPWERILAESVEERRAAGLEQRVDPRVAGTLVLVALVMIFQHYLGDRDTFAKHFADGVPERWADLLGLCWWAGAKVIGYAIVPLVCLRLFAVPATVLHVQTDGFVRHLRAYALLYLVVLPFVVFVSSTKAFQHTYPFYRLAARSWTDVLAWELAYAASFIALELFYRGFILGMLRRSLGPYAIFVMIVPYCMIHFGKPAIESVGAILAGTALGTLAMRTRSIWGGVAIHVSIAWSMDLLAILRTTGLPSPENAARMVGG